MSVSLSASQPLSLSASQPLSLSASQPLSLSASQPLSLSASQPLSLSASQPLSLSASQPQRVLIVDDDKASQIFEAKVLERMGLEVDVAINGAEAIDFLSRTDYALVLMDCLMPVMDGIEATKLIREGSANARDPDIPIIAITADAMSENLNACKLAGMNDCLTKPASSAALREIVQKWLPAARAT